MSLQLKNIPWEYEAYQEIFEETEQSFTPAYMHGMAWAFVVTIGEKGMIKNPFFQKLNELESAIFKKLYDISAQQIQDEALSIELLLPLDEAPLSERLEALVDWCEGFLQGIQLSDTSQSSKLNPKAQEILKDIEAIAGLNCDEVSTEDNERYYQELIEFMRVAVLLLEANIHQPDVAVKDKAPLLH